jgi:hypothetical protein
MTGKAEVEQVELETARTILGSDLGWLTDCYDRADRDDKREVEERLAESLARHRPRWPTNSVDVEQRARELLAAQQEIKAFADDILTGEGRLSVVGVDQALRAICAALSGSRLSNEGVALREALERIAGSWTQFKDEPGNSLASGYKTQRDMMQNIARQALSSLQPASLSEESGHE